MDIYSLERSMYERVWPMWGGWMANCVVELVFITFMVNVSL